MGTSEVATLDKLRIRSYSRYKMIDTTSKTFLFVEPAAATATPILDSLTRRVTAAYRAGRKSEYNYRGCFVAQTGACSDAYDHWITLADGTELLTHSLVVHYVAHCRSQIPASELAKLERLPAAEAEPTAEELFHIVPGLASLTF